MEHITNQYGRGVNYLKMPSEAYFKVLDPFLLELGIRSRVMSSYYQDGVCMVEVQADNPYKVNLISYSSLSKETAQAYLNAEYLMKPDSLMRYKQ